MRIYQILVALMSSGFFATGMRTQAAQKKTDKPNLIIIYTDEQNFCTLGCYRDLMTEDQAFIWGKGNAVSTPNIDKIASEGVPYEASGKIPFVLRYPNKVKAGKVIPKIFTNVDCATTILAMMDVKNDVPFHGTDTSKGFLSKKKKLADDRIVYFS